MDGNKEASGSSGSSTNGRRFESPLKNYSRIYSITNSDNNNSNLNFNSSSPVITTTTTAANNNTSDRNNLSEHTPLLAPFVQAPVRPYGHIRSYSHGAGGGTNSITSSSHSLSSKYPQIDNLKSNSSLTSVSSQREARNQPYRNRFKSHGDVRDNSIPNNNASPRGSLPRLKIYDEFGEPVSRQSTRGSVTSGEVEQDDNKEKEAESDIDENVDKLKENLKYDVVGKISTAETDLKNKLEAMERSLSELKQLRDKSIKLIKKFETTTHTADEEISTQLSKLQKSQVSIDVVEGLEKRVEKAKERVDECRKRLNHVNQKVIIQENDNKQRRQRLEWAKWGVLSFLLIICLMFLLVKYSLRQRYDYHSIINCLDDLNSCNLH